MGRSVLVLNSGSSSLKYALYSLKQKATCIAKGVIEGIGSPKCSITHRNLQVEQNVKMQGCFCNLYTSNFLKVDPSAIFQFTSYAHPTSIQGSAVKDHSSGLKKVLELLRLDKGHSDTVFAVGHRVVHGGEQLTKPALVTENVKKAIEKAVPLAPLHNPSNLEGIRVAEELFTCPQVAVFDTGFHSTIPPKAYMYGIPYSYYEELGLRRYGFHGTSYEYIVTQVAKHFEKPRKELNIIACHLGAGASLAAIKNGSCIDTTMGITPLEGLVMATRSGDIDPAVFEILESSRKMSIGQISSVLNKESGIYGICGEKDMKTVIELSEAGSEKHTLALQVYIHRIRKYLGAFYLHLGGRIDAVVFSAGVGERSSIVRHMACCGLELLGITLDKDKNQADGDGLREIQAEGSRIKVLIVPTDEELAIAQQTLEVVNESHA